MAHAYTPGLKASSSQLIQRTRRLPIPGDVLVEKGDVIQPDQTVARTELPGDPLSLNIANRMGVEPEDINSVLKVQEGDEVEEGDVLAFSSSFFGLIKREERSPVSGTIEMISTVSGQMVMREPPIPLELHGYIKGIVIEVMPEEGIVVQTRGAFIQGIFGIGGERRGEIKVMVDDSGEILDASEIDSDCEGKVLVVGSLATSDILHRADEVGAKGVVAAGIIDEDLVDYLGHDIGVAITGQEEIPLTLIVTEGFGPMRIADKTFSLLQNVDGQDASLNGATQIRAGVMRPEIICPEEGFEESLASETAAGDDASEADDGAGLDVGTPIRIIREPYFGYLAEVTELPPELQVIESEARVRVLRARLQDGTEVTVPRANVEIIED